MRIHLYKLSCMQKLVIILVIHETQPHKRSVIYDQIFEVVLKVQIRGGHQKILKSTIFQTISQNTPTQVGKLFSFYGFSFHVKDELEIIKEIKWFEKIHGTCLEEKIFSLLRRDLPQCLECFQRQQVCWLVIFPNQIIFYIDTIMPPQNFFGFLRDLLHTIDFHSSRDILKTLGGFVTWCHGFCLINKPLHLIVRAEAYIN